MDVKKINHILSMFANNMLVMLSASQNFSSTISNGVQDLLPRLASGKIESNDLSQLVEWTGASCDELESLIRRVSSLKTDSDKAGKTIADLQDSRFRDIEERDRLHTQHIQATTRDHNEIIKEVS